ncbi:MAG TPA: SGNH/GDSL hydrolase family protein [Bryobacteraceae bacterium]|nr:SGNH/GDSL hydrolase family protein [Bryobacteraceae bacterium]
MRLCSGVLSGLVATVTLFLLVSPFQGATKKKATKKRPTPAPAISAAARAASLRKVSDYLEVTPRNIEQPGALVPVFEQLFRISAEPGKAAAPVHILHFGDSHTAADDWTGGLRDQFKDKFGDGGSGFSLAGHPFAGYRRFDVHGGATPYWQTHGLASAAGDGFFGLGGVSISTERPGQSVYIDAECDFLEVEYLQQPGGGDLALYDYDERLEQFSTNGATGPGFIRYQVPAGLHHFSLRTLDARPVRLFGWVADKSAGVTYEALGINGAEAAVMMRWDENMLATYLQRRNPGLIVLAYGTNEAGDPNWNPESYRAMFSNLLQRLRSAVPAASILVLGPTDRWYRYKGVMRPLAGIDDIIAAQQLACRENGCAYWNTRERMGGKGSMRDWVFSGLGQPDYVHLTSTGYRRLAAVLFSDIFEQYQTYRKTRLEIADPISHGQAN